MSRAFRLGLASVLACALLTQAPEPLRAQKTGSMRDCSAYQPPEGMEALRCRAWQLFIQATGERPVFDSPLWIPKRKVFPIPKPEGGGKGIDLSQVAEIPAEFYMQDTEKKNPDKFLGKNIPPQPLTFESVFFNFAAARHIRRNRLNAKGTTQSLQNASRTEIPEFPKEAIVVKTFWRAVPESGPPVKVGVWGWTNLPKDPGRLFEVADPPIGFTNGSVCVEIKPKPGSGCLEAGKHFLMSRVRRRGEGVDCSGGASCSPEDLPEGTKVILLGMHIVSKEKPDWLWATFWWKGVKRADSLNPATAAWTCDNAQRPPELATGLPSNYAMDVTTSLKALKPKVGKDEEASCGSPPNIGNREERLAMFNPFSEELQPGGRKSSCINCHSNANTSQIIPSIPVVCDAGQPLLESFEGHVRTDYSWSVALALGPTQNPVEDRSNPAPQPPCLALHAATP